MRLSTTGKALMVGAVLSIDGVTPAGLAPVTGSNDAWGWLDTDTIGGNGSTGGPFTLKKYVISTDTLSALDAHGANTFRAGNSVWDAYLTGQGVRSSVSGLGPFPISSLGDVDETGILAIIQNFQAGRGIQCYTVGGSLLSTVDVSLIGGSNVRCRNGYYGIHDITGACHIYHATTGTFGGYAPRTDAVVVQVIPVVIGGTLYAVELDGLDQLIIRPATSTMGYLIATGPTSFAIDVMPLTATTVRIGWSHSAGETLTDLRLADLDITTGMTTLGSSATGSLVFAAPASGTTITSTVGPVEGGNFFAGISLPQHQPVVDQSRIIDPIWLAALQGGIDAATGPVNASKLTGVIPPANGGTGVTTGLSSLNGQNLLPGSVPCSALQADCLAELQSGWIPLVTGAEPPVFVTDGSGVLILVAGPS